MTGKKILFYAAIFLVSFGITRIYFHNPTNLTKNTVMIVNKEMNHGGSGVILDSTKAGSFVLTNAHVCNVVKTGGVVRATTGDYQVQSFIQSKVSDLCLIYLPANLGQRTKLAAHEPKIFSISKVAGHPALMPTIISMGHFSNRQIISVISGTRACTDADLADPINSVYCQFFGAVPIIKSYDSQLVSSTIMPGSSGSAVYNENNELSGLVFAGQGDFGYGWIVTYDQVKAFVEKESQTTDFTDVDQTLNQTTTEQKKTSIKEMRKKCLNAVDNQIVRLCEVLKHDIDWVK